MRTLFIWIFLLMLSIESRSQQTANDLVGELNKTISIYGADDASALTFLEKIGILEQKINTSSSQRIRLGDLGMIHVQANTNGFVVNIGCNESTPCISLIKGDMTTSQLPSNSFFFNDARGANEFAKNLEKLTNRFKTQGQQITAQLYGAPGNSAPAMTATSTKSKTVTKEKDQDETDKDEPDASEKKEKKVAKTEAEMKADAIARREAGAAKKTAAKDEEDEDNDKQEKKERKAPKTEAEMKADVEARREAARERREAAREVHYEEATDPRVAQPGSSDEEEPLCKRLTAILNAGKASKYKSIEGSETNATAKINESKVKLKGAKKSYLSWYKNERAFIAEYKTSSDREAIVSEFEKLQTELEACLVGGWEDIDHSSDAMYANSNDDVKDVEYKLTTDAAMPSLRIMINTDKEKKHTLFVRIQ